MSLYFCDTRKNGGRIAGKIQHSPGGSGEDGDSVAVPECFIHETLRGNFGVSQIANRSIDIVEVKDNPAVSSGRRT